MPFVAAAENYALDQLGTNKLLYASLHSAYSATGANELTGGSPAYARKVLAWSAAASGGKNLSAPPVFDVPPGSTVGWVGYWDASSAGNFQGMAAAGSGQPMSFSALASSGVLTAPGSALTNTTAVVVLPAVGATLPAGLTAGTIYYVVSASGATFKLAATSGGVAITLTADGAGIVQTIVGEVYAGQGTYTVANPGSGALLSLV